MFLHELLVAVIDPVHAPRKGIFLHRFRNPRFCFHGWGRENRNVDFGPFMVRTVYLFSPRIPLNFVKGYWIEKKIVTSKQRNLIQRPKLYLKMTARSSCSVENGWKLKMVNGDSREKLDSIFDEFFHYFLFPNSLLCFYLQKFWKYAPGAAPVLF